MERLLCRYALTGMLLLLLCGCFDGQTDDLVEADKGRLTLKVSLFERIPFGGDTRAYGEPEDYATRLNYAFFDGTTKVKSIAQQAGDEDFGTLQVTLDKGTYTLVVVAHSQPSSPTISSPDKVQFKNPMTDSFSYTADITVGDEEQTQEVVLHRVVAKVEFRCLDPMPDQVATVQFKYSGGSLRLDATTGFGSANSQQNASFAIDEDLAGQTVTFELYTIPHEEDDRLSKLTVTALDAANRTVAEKVFTNVPIAPGQITVYRGNFFGSDDDGGMKVVVDGDWKKTRIFEF